VADGGPPAGPAGGVDLGQHLLVAGNGFRALPGLPLDLAVEEHRRDVVGGRGLDVAHHHGHRRLRVLLLVEQAPHVGAHRHQGIGTHPRRRLRGRELARHLHPVGFLGGDPGHHHVSLELAALSGKGQQLVPLPLGLVDAPAGDARCLQIELREPDASPHVAGVECDRLLVRPPPLRGEGHLGQHPHVVDVLEAGVGQPDVAVGEVRLQLGRALEALFRLLRLALASRGPGPPRQRPRAPGRTPIAPTWARAPPAPQDLAGRRHLLRQGAGRGERPRTAARGGVRCGRRPPLRATGTRAGTIAGGS
jgi:hypothetical protein